MSLRRKYSCEGKAFLPTKAAAKRVAEKRRNISKEKLHAYRCRFCPGWHIGHPPQSHTRRTD